jgi:lactoylglutathione lyase
MLQFRVSVLIVRDVPAAVSFYEQAFGLGLHYMHPARGYAELETGTTLLAFLGEAFLDEAALLGGLRTRPNRPELDPVAAHIALWSNEIDRDWSRALAAGAVLVKPLEQKPWGQTVGYLRDQDGIVVELCTPSPRETRPC